MSAKIGDGPSIYRQSINRLASYYLSVSRVAGPIIDDFICANRTRVTVT